MIIYEDLHIPPMFLTLYRESNIPAEHRYKNRAAYLLQRKLGGYLPPELYYKKLQLSEKDDKIIVFDSGTSPEYLNWLCNKYSDQRIILFFWNPVTHYRFDDLNPKVEIWTYSEKDSLKYKLKLNTQFYFDVLAEEAERCTPTVPSAHPKTLFIGREKGRSGALRELQNKLTAAGAEVTLQLVQAPRHLAHLREKTVPYREIVKLITQTDVILDYALDPEAGLSLRPMEAMFWGRKLITNNTRILSMDFYHPNNIYVLGKDSRSLEEFFRYMPQPVEKTVRDRYRLSSWLKRFDEEA